MITFVGRLLQIGQMLSVHAGLQPDKLAVRDSRRSMTFREWNERAARLANALVGLGLRKGDRVAILAYNCIEWMEVYLGLAKAGLVAVPLNFRLAPSETRYIVDDAGASALIVQDDLLAAVEEIRTDLAPGMHLLHFGSERCPAGYQSFEELMTAASASEPSVSVELTDTWAFMYTSGWQRRRTACRCGCPSRSS